MINMTRSFDTWDSLNEMLFAKRIKGSTNFYKIQDKKSFRFFMKNLKDFNKRVQLGKLTEFGATEIIRALNNEPEFVSKFGKLDTSFFKDKVLLYKVKKEKPKVVAIQFKYYPRDINLITSLGFTADTQFISTDEFSVSKNKDLKVKEVIADIESKAKTEVAEEGELDTEAKGTPETSKLEGNSFDWTMRTNGILYKFTFNSKGALDAVPQNSSYPDANVSFEDSKIMWYVDTPGKNAAAKLSSDTEITSTPDKNFLLKMFTDAKFRKEYLEKETEKFTGTYDKDTIKSVLYYVDDTKIYPEYKKSISKSKKKKKSEDTKAIITGAIAQSKAKHEKNT